MFERTRFARLLPLTVLVALVVVFLYYVKVFDKLRLDKTVEQLIISSYEPEPDSRIVVIGIHKKVTAKLRQEHIKLINMLSDSVNVLGIDIVMKAETDFDTDLANAISKSKAKIVLGVWNSGGTAIPPNEALLEAKPSLGVITLGLTDARIDKFMTNLNREYAGFALKMAEESGRSTEKFTSKYEIIQYGRRVEVLDYDKVRAGTVRPANGWKNKIVLVGQTFDREDRYYGWGESQWYGVEIHAQVLNMVLKARPIRYLDSFAEILLIILTTFAIGSGLLKLQYRRTWITPVLIVGSVAMVLLVVFWFHQSSQLIRVMYPLTALFIMSRGVLYKLKSTIQPEVLERVAEFLQTEAGALLVGYQEHASEGKTARSSSAKKRGVRTKSPRDSELDVVGFSQMQLYEDEIVTLKEEIMISKDAIHELRIRVAEKGDDASRYDRRKLAEKTADFEEKLRRLRTFLEKVKGEKIDIDGLIN